MDKKLCSGKCEDCGRFSPYLQIARLVRNGRARMVCRSFYMAHTDNNSLPLEFVDPEPIRRFKRELSSQEYQGDYWLVDKLVSGELG